VRFSDEAILRLVVAVVLGAVIGVERESGEQPAGLRTHIAVSVGACLFGVVSTLGFDEFRAERATTNFQVDVTRVASQVVVGIGFLGAGIIFRQGGVVKNLTTAASLWVTAAIGLTAGVGDLGTAAVATLVMVVALVALLPMRDWIRHHLARETRELRIRLATGSSPGEAIEALHALDGVDVERLVVEREGGDYVLLTELKAERTVSLDERIGRISTRPDVADLGEQSARST